MSRPAAGDGGRHAAQQWEPHTYAKNARFVAELGQDVLALLSPRPGERVLDLGCGDGALTVQLVLAGCSVVAVDSSAAQAAAARARGLDVCVAQGESLPFAGEFDAVFSNAALHWMREADAVVSSVHRALKPRGRFVGELGGAGNVSIIRGALADALSCRGLDPDAHDPWFFPTPEQYRRLLEARGFTVTHLVLFPRPTPLPTGMEGWLETFAQPFLGALPAGDRRDVVRTVCAAVRPHLYDPVRGWTADYVRLRFAAERIR